MPSLTCSPWGLTGNVELSDLWQGDRVGGDDDPPNGQPDLVVVSGADADTPDAGNLAAPDSGADTESRGTDDVGNLAAVGSGAESRGTSDVGNLAAALDGGAESRGTGDAAFFASMGSAAVAGAAVVARTAPVTVPEKRACENYAKAHDMQATSATMDMVHASAAGILHYAFMDVKTGSRTADGQAFYAELKKEEAMKEVYDNLLEPLQTEFS